MKKNETSNWKGHIFKRVRCKQCDGLWVNSKHGLIHDEVRIHVGERTGDDGRTRKRKR